MIFGTKICRQFRKVFFTSRANTVIDFYGFVPIVHIGFRGSGAVSSPFGRAFAKFPIGQGILFASKRLVPIFPIGDFKPFVGIVVKIVVHRIHHRCIVFCPKIGGSFWIGQTLIVSGDMVGYNINEHLHPSGMGSLNKCLELFKSIFDVLGQIWIDVVVILYCVWRTCSPLDHVRIVIGNSIHGIIGDHIVVWNTCVPNIGHTQILDFLQSFFTKVVEFSNTILFDGAPWLVSGIGISK